MTLRHKFIGLMSLLALVLNANIATAAELTLRSNISIVDNIVTLGDLFENAGTAAKIAVFRSPKLGRNGILKSSRIKTAARTHGLKWLNPRHLDKITVRRAFHTIDLEEISNRIGQELANNYPLQVSNSQLEISLNKKSVPFIIRADADTDFEIKKIRYNHRSGRFSVIISSPVGSPQARGKTYNGRATEVIEVPMLAQALSRGQTITASHLKTKKVTARRISERTVTEAVDLIGMALRRSLRPNSLISKNDVENPKIVKKNTLVSVIYKLQSLHITFRGKALEDGAQGETITVLNTRSRRTIQAVVSAPSVVLVMGNRLQQTASLGK